MQQPLHTKLFKNNRVFAQAEDETYQLTICSIFDLASTESKCQAFTIPGIGGKWEDDSEDPKYGWVESDDSFTGTTADTPLTWAGPGIAELTYDSHSKAKFMQLVFKQYEKDAPVTLLGWGASGAIFGGI
jgi:hypothetical protein